MLAVDVVLHVGRRELCLEHTHLHMQQVDLGLRLVGLIARLGDSRLERGDLARRTVALNQLHTTHRKQFALCACKYRDKRAVGLLGRVTQCLTQGCNLQRRLGGDQGAGSGEGLPSQCESQCSSNASLKE